MDTDDESSEFTVNGQMDIDESSDDNTVNGQMDVERSDDDNTEDEQNEVNPTEVAKNKRPAKCPCKRKEGKSWPAAIMKDSLVCKLPKTQDLLTSSENIIESSNTQLHKTMKQVVFQTTMFNYVENIYNSDNEYYYGELPYRIQNMLYKYINTSSKNVTLDNFKSYIEQKIIMPYIHKTSNLDYRNTDYNKIRLLIAFVLMKMSKTTDIFGNVVEQYNNIVEQYKNIVKHYNNVTFYHNINYLYGNDLYSIDLNKQLNLTPCANVRLRAAIINQYISPGITGSCSTIRDIVSSTHTNLYGNDKNPEYTSVMNYLGWNNDNSSFANIDLSINSSNNSLLSNKAGLFDTEYDELINTCCSILKNINLNTISYNSLLSRFYARSVNPNIVSLLKRSTTLHKDILDINLLENYYYTSMLMYTQFELPPIKANDDGNGRLSEYMLSNVYYSYAVYIYTNGNIDLNNLPHYSENHTYDKYDNIYSNGGYYMLNIRKLCSMYIRYFCPDGVYTKRLLNQKDPHCQISFNQGYNIYADVYNKINIDKDYVIVKLSDTFKVQDIDNIFESLSMVYDSSTDLQILQNILTLYQHFVIIFAPLRPLVNYYSIMENTTEERRWFNKNLNMYDDNLAVNNDSGGDLYCACKNNFYLLDSKRYDDFDTCDKVKTLIQSWMYMNVYWRPLCCIFNNVSNMNYELYTNYYLGFINPLHNEISAYNYNEISIFINNQNNKYDQSDDCNCTLLGIINDYYKFNTSKNNVFDQNKNKILQNIIDTEQSKKLEDMTWLQWSIDNARRQTTKQQNVMTKMDEVGYIQQAHKSTTIARKQPARKVKARVTKLIKLDTSSKHNNHKK